MIYIRPSRKKALSFLLYVQGWVKLQCLSSYLPCVSSLLFRFLLFQRRRMEGKVVCVNQLKSTVEQRQKKWVISTEEVQAFNLSLSLSRVSGHGVGLKGRKTTYRKNALAAILSCISRWQHHGANRGETLSLRQSNGRFETISITIWNGCEKSFTYFFYEVQM